MIFTFGTFAFDDRAAMLTRSDRAVPLEPQPARALALLLSRAGEVVTRDELRGHLWGADTHVDYDRGLAYCIGQLRTSLGDSADNPRFIQTLPRRGFRFIAPVESIPAATGDTGTPRSRFAMRARAFVSGAGFKAVAAAAVVVILAGGVMFVRHRLFSGPIVAVAGFNDETAGATHEHIVSSLSDVVVERLTALGSDRLGVNGNAT